VTCGLQVVRGVELSVTRNNVWVIFGGNKLKMASKEEPLRFDCV